MKLPHNIPDELYELISLTTSKNLYRSQIDELYSYIADYFNNLPTEWHPVSAKPEDDCDVWLFGGSKGVYLGSYKDGYFRTDKYGYAGVRANHWTYAYLPEPPKE